MADGNSPADFLDRIRTIFATCDGIMDSIQRRRWEHTVDDSWGPTTDGLMLELYGSSSMYDRRGSAAEFLDSISAVVAGKEAG